MEAMAREILAELATSPIVFVPDLDDVADDCRAFHGYCDASIDEMSGTIDLQQPDVSAGVITYMSWVILVSDRTCTKLDLEAGSINLPPKRCQMYIWGAKFRILFGHKASDTISEAVDHTARVQRRLEGFVAFDYTLKYRKGYAQYQLVFRPVCYLFTEPAMDHDRCGCTHVDDGRTVPFRALELRTRS